MSMLLQWKDVGETTSSPGVSRRILDGTGASVVQVAIKAGTKADRHAHPFEQFVQVISGGGRLTTAEGSGRFSGGSLFHFPAGAWHEAEFDEDTILVETNLAAP